MDDALPRHAQLPATAGAPPGSSWGIWGEDDRLGCLNLLTPERLVAAARRSSTPSSASSTATANDDLLDGFNTQSATQWDGFRHIRNPEHGWFGGHHGGFHGVAALDAQGTGVEAGDVLLIRTGWLGWYRTLDDATRSGMARRHSNPGLVPGERTAAALWDLGLSAVAADNPSLEVWPWGEDKLHDRLLPLLGMPIGELFDLDALAEDCVVDGRYACLFTSAPLRLRAGVASPPGALAIK